MSVQQENLLAIANAIREKEGSTDPIPAGEFAERIRGIQTGVDTSDATAEAGDILGGKTAYVKGNKVAGSMAAVEQAAPSISIREDRLTLSCVITAKADQAAGYVEEGTKSSTHQLPTQGGNTITPGRTEITAVRAGRYTTGVIKVKGDANLAAENIKSGVSIFGVAGSYTGGDVSASVTVVNDWTTRGVQVGYVSGNTNEKAAAGLDANSREVISVKAKSFIYLAPVSDRMSLIQGLQGGVRIETYSENSSGMGLAILFVEGDGTVYVS